jgi:competence protein ComEA
MDKAPAAPASSPPSTAIAATPPVASPASPTPLLKPQRATASVLDAWPRSAQWTTAILLGVALALLTIHALGNLRTGSRPAEFQRGMSLSYRVDLNRARRAELLQLPGIGDSTARRIEDYRLARPFRSVDDLAKVRGIGPATLERLRPWVFVDAETAEEKLEAATIDVKPMPMLDKHASASPRAGAAADKSKKAAALHERIDINEASPEDLRRLPGIGPKLSQRIAEERRKRDFKTVDDLRRVAGIGAKTLERLRPYIKVQSTDVRIAVAE